MENILNITLPLQAFCQETNLNESFENNGILTPILIAEIQNSKFIIDGIKRYSWAVLNHKKINQVTISADSLEEALYKRYALNEQPKSFIDKINTIHFIIKNQLNLKQISSKISLPYRKQNIKWITNISNIHPIIINAIGNNCLKEKSMGIWSLFHPEDLKTTVLWMNHFIFNQNQDKKFFELLWHIHIVNQISIPDILHSMEIPNLSPPKKTEFTLNYLRTKAYPILSDKEEQIRQLVNELNRDSSSTFSWIDMGEENEYKCGFIFQNIEEYQNKIHLLSQPELLNKIKKLTEVIQLK